VTDKRLRVPAHIVYRELVRETVVFNLQTGAYLSLSRRAGQLLALIERHGDVEAAAAEIARRSGRPLESVRPGISGYCEELVRSGLLEPDRGRRGRAPVKGSPAG
jgi:coenzyme PQQ synthesis protein D (PqqD)